MSVVRLTAGRTIGAARNTGSTAVYVGAFLATSFALFAFRLNAAEGSRLLPAVVWSVATAAVLPFLAALLGMDVWSEERRTGRLDVLLSSPVSESDLVLGKFLGVWAMTAMATLFALVVSGVLLHLYAPAVRIGWRSGAVAFSALALQSLAWSALAVACSAIFSRAALAACATVFLSVVLPRGLWFACACWSPHGRPHFGEMPLDAHVADLSSGMISLATVLTYGVLAALALFLTVAFVERRRYVGRGCRSVRVVIGLRQILAVVFSALLTTLLWRVDVLFEWPVTGRAPYSKRTLGILSETHGHLEVTCFLSRSDPHFHAASRELRRLSRTASAHGGLKITVRFVDPAWDLGEANRLVRAGVKPGNVLFAYGRRSTSIPVADGLGERVCASTILRLTVPPQHRNVRWTRGHGECAYDDYGPFGMSDIARELSRDGYVNQPIDLARTTRIPSDCALIVIAGARDEFSRDESACLDAYLKQGGRLLVMMNAGEAGGVQALLAGWGVSVGPLEAPAPTVSGSDVIASRFAEHPITAPLAGLSILLEKPLAFRPSAAVRTSSAVGRIDFSALVTVGSACVAALVERGENIGNDLAFRPTRIVVVGDSQFVTNAQLASRANANRDFFLNVVACLSGTDAITPGGVDGERLVSGMDRQTRRRLALVGVCFVPLAAALFLSAVAFRRRHRK